jgi:hypothetical protein
MLCPIDIPIIAFYFDGNPVPRHLPLADHAINPGHGTQTQLFEDKQLERERLLAAIKKHVAMLGRKSRMLWDSDKNLETSKWKQRLLKTPDVAVPELERSYQGCVYLIEYWEYLKGKVNDSMFDRNVDTEDSMVTSSLMGIPFYQRTGWRDFMSAAHQGSNEECRAFLIKIYDEQLARLRTLADERKQMEDHEYEMETQFAEFHPDKTLRKLKRELRQIERELYHMTVNSLTDLGIIEDDEAENEQLEANSPVNEASDEDSQADGQIVAKSPKPKTPNTPTRYSGTYTREWKALARGIKRPRVRRSKPSEIAEKKQE